MGCRRVWQHLRRVGFLAPSLKGQGTVMAGAKESVLSGQRELVCVRLHTHAFTRIQSYSGIRARADTLAVAVNTALRRERRASGLAVPVISASDSEGHPSAESRRQLL